MKIVNLLLLLFISAFSSCVVKSRCYNDKECADPEVCRQGKCILQCIDKSGCLEWEDCVKNRCVPVFSDTKAPGFILTDLNPNSLTYKKNVSLNELTGMPLFMFFGTAGCQSCAEKFKGLAEFREKINSGGKTPFNAVAVNHWGLEDFVAQFAGNVTLPVLQDTKEISVFKLYSAESYNLFIIDTQGYIFAKDAEAVFPDREETYKKILQILYSNPPEHAETGDISEPDTSNEIKDAWEEKDVMETAEEVKNETEIKIETEDQIEGSTDYLIPEFFESIEDSYSGDEEIIMDMQAIDEQDEYAAEEIVPADAVSDAFLKKLPQVTLKDLNPQSATYNSNITIPDDFADKIELIYFGSASCGYCVTQAGQIKTVLDELKLEGISDAVEIVINNKGLDAYAYKFGSGTDGPVLQDTTEIDAWKILSASSNNLFMVDKQGYIVFLHTSVSFPADNEKIKDEVKSLK